MFYCKATNEQLIESYNRTKSVWKTGAEFGMCGQSVHERLSKLGLIKKINVFSESDYKILKEFYETHELKMGSNELEEIAKKLGRTKSFICRKAKELGLTSQNRGQTEKFAKENSERTKQWYKTHEHPKGMQGKHHSEKTKERLKETTKRYFSNRSDEETYQVTKKIITARHKKGIKTARKASWKAGVRKIGKKQILFRSRWEYNYALYLEHLKKTKQIKKWEYEPDIFWFEGIKRGCVSYKPDFKITRKDNSIYYIEIKGWMDSKSKTKLKRMAKYHPEIELVLVDSTAYKKFKKEWQTKLKNWEE